MGEFLLASDIKEIVDTLAPHSPEFLGQFSGKRLLITGGCGFLGRYFVSTFLSINQWFTFNNQEPCELVILDNLITSGAQGNNFSSSKNIAFVKHDIIKPFYPERPVDFILHAAGIASPFYYRKYPMETLEVATTGLKNVLELARVNPHCKLSFFSSSEIYGDPDPKRVPTPESYRGNVSSLGPRACYDDKTEILTEDGWVPFPQLQKGRKVATLNGDRVEYYIPDEYVSYDYVGELINFSNTKLDLCVTPNHKMYVKDKSNKFIFKQADDIKYGASWRIATGASFEGQEFDEKEFDQNLSRLRHDLRRVKMDDWLEFLGYYLSEGCSYQREAKQIVNGKEYDSVHYSVQIAQVKPDGRRKIAACLDRIGINYFDTDDHAFRICSKYLSQLLKPLGKSYEKRIPREYMNLSPRQSKILLDSMIVGDGTTRGSNSCYYTTSKNLADDVQELALRCGYTSSQRVYPPRYPNGWSKRPLYHVRIRPARLAKLPDPRKSIYCGKVYCVNVRNHVICVRRNGKISWCGNCYDEGKRLGETLVRIYHEQYGVHANIIRPFNVYGPGMQKTDYRVLPNFASKILSGEPLNIYGTGNQTRTFCYVTDAIAGFLKVLMLGVPGEPYNIGNPHPEISILGLAHELEVVMDRKLPINVIDYPDSYPADEPNRRCPDITKAKLQVGYKPVVPLHEGLSRFMRWARENYLE